MHSRRIVAIVAVVATAGLLALGSGPSSAVGEVLTAGTNTTTASGTPVAVTGFNVTGGSGDVQVSLATSVSGVGTITLGTLTGLTFSSGDGTADESMAFRGTLANVNAALASVSFTPAPGFVGVVTINSQASDADGVANPDNGHYYQFVNTGDVTWAAANTAAGGMSYYGLTGYLATITSQAEEVFVQSKIGAAEAWIGGSDAGTEGDWKWVGGPEAGTTFWLAACTTGLQGVCGTTGQFNFWSASEPNNFGGPGEDNLQIVAGGSGFWNDFPDSFTLPYIVEFGGLGSATFPTGVTTVTVTAAVAVPSGRTNFTG